MDERSRQSVISRNFERLMEKADNSVIDVQRLYAEQGDGLFRELYRTEREPFVQWAAKTFKCPKAKAKEIFHDSLTIFYTKVATKEVTVLRSSIKTYLYGIGRNLLMRTYKHEGKEIAVEGIDVAHEEEQTMDDETLTHLLASLHELNEGCIRLLTLFYYRNYAIDAIAAEMGFDSLDVVRTKKYKCLQQLKKKFRSRLDKE